MRDVLVTRSVTPSVVDTIELLTSEVVTNAIVHGASDPELVVRLHGNRVRVEVQDSAPAVPVRRFPGPLSSSGRGLAIVDELAWDWGIDHVPRGKRVWFEVPFKTAPLPAWVRRRFAPAPVM